jgi:hypothetical protein
MNTYIAFLKSLSPADRARFSQWEDELTTYVEIEMQMCRSDAQGAVEAHQQLVIDSWKQDKSALDCYRELIKVTAEAR